MKSSFVVIGFLVPGDVIVFQDYAEMVISLIPIPKNPLWVELALMRLWSAPDLSVPSGYHRHPGHIIYECFNRSAHFARSHLLGK